LSKRAAPIVLTRTTRDRTGELRISRIADASLV
jgi:hypothetical protein